MTILNRGNKRAVADGGSTLPSNMSLKSFGDAMSQLDLSSIPPHRRKAALKAHVLRLAAVHLEDRTLANDIMTSYLQHLPRH